MKNGRIASSVVRSALCTSHAGGEAERARNFQARRPTSGGVWGPLERTKVRQSLNFSTLVLR